MKIIYPHSEIIFSLHSFMLISKDLFFTIKPLFSACGARSLNMEIRIAERQILELDFPRERTCCALTQSIRLLL
jgi:hypothetical protein